MRRATYLEKCFTDQMFGLAPVSETLKVDFDMSERILTAMLTLQSSLNNANTSVLSIFSYFEFSTSAGETIVTTGPDTSSRSSNTACQS